MIQPLHVRSTWIHIGSRIGCYSWRIGHIEKHGTRHEWGISLLNSIKCDRKNSVNWILVPIIMWIWCTGIWQTSTIDGRNRRQGNPSFFYFLFASLLDYLSWRYRTYWENLTAIPIRWSVLHLSLLMAMWYENSTKDLSKISSPYIYV